MKLIKTFYIVILIWPPFGCMAQKQDCVSLKLVNKYEFPVNNSDTLAFSFVPYENDESYSARSVALSPDGKYAFICDAGHGNIKRLNLTDGSVKVSRTLNHSPSVALFDIAAINDQVFVTTEKSVIILTIDLEYVRSEFVTFSLPNFTEFAFASRDSVGVIINGKQQKDLSLNQSILSIVDKKTKVSHRNIPIQQFTSELNRTHRHGKVYQVENRDKGCDLRTSYGCFRLDRQIPDLAKYFTGRNIDFVKNTTVFFNATPKVITIFYYGT